MLAELRDRDAVEQQATMVMERIAAGQGKRRGRPPAWMASAEKRRGRLPGSKNRPKAAKSRVAAHN
jgi:hypothetical protein